VNLRTVFPPMPTPFRDGEVDTDAIRRNVRRFVESGLGGVVALGTNGEAAMLDDEEGDHVVAAARDAVPSDKVLIAGVGRESTRATIAAAKRAAAAGADAVLARTPSFYRAHTPVPALLEHYTALADASPIPVLLYNYAGFTGVNLSPCTIGRLAEHPNVVGLKETSTDGAQFVEIAAVVPSRFTIMAGSAPGVYAAMCAGATGAILAVACVRPRLCLELFEHLRAQRLGPALLCQQQLMPLARAVTTGFGIAGLKAAMDLAGMYGGDPRLPIAPLGGDGREKIRALLDATR
jgi:4-hydroxy-2-oxoglutarate aldolase